MASERTLEPGSKYIPIVAMSAAVEAKGEIPERMEVSDNDGEGDEEGDVDDGEGDDVDDGDLHNLPDAVPDIKQVMHMFHYSPEHKNETDYHAVVDLHPEQKLAERDGYHFLSNTGADIYPRVWGLARTRTAALAIAVPATHPCPVMVSKIVARGAGTTIASPRRPHIVHFKDVLYESRSYIELLWLPITPCLDTARLTPLRPYVTTLGVVVTIYPPLRSVEELLNTFTRIV